MRIACTLVLAGLLIVAPLAQAEEDESPVVVRAKPGLDLDALARTLLGSDEGLARSARKIASKLEPGDLQDLLRRVRRMAHGMKGGARKAMPWSDGDRPIINVEARVIVAPRDALAVRPTAQDPVRFLDPTQVESILRAVEKSQHVEVISAPSLSAFDGQRASISTINQVSYVQDYEVEVGNTTTISDPVVGIVQEGLVLDIRSILSKDRKFLTVELEGTWSKVGRPIAEMEVELAAGVDKVKIQLPEVTSTRLRANATMRSGSHVLVGGGPLFEKDGKAFQRMILLRANLVDVPGASKKK